MPFLFPTSLSYHASTKSASTKSASDDSPQRLATEVPAKYVMDMMFRNQNLGQGFAASTMMLMFVVIILVPWTVYEYREKRRG